MLGKARMCSAPSLSSLPKASVETVPMFGSTQIIPDLGEWNVGNFLSFLHSSFLKEISVVMFWPVLCSKSSSSL